MTAAKSHSRISTISWQSSSSLHSFHTLYSQNYFIGSWESQEPYRVCLQPKRQYLQKTIILIKIILSLRPLALMKKRNSAISFTPNLSSIKIFLSESLQSIIEGLLSSSSTAVLSFTNFWMITALTNSLKGGYILWLNSRKPKKEISGS